MCVCARAFARVSQIRRQSLKADVRDDYYYIESERVNYDISIYEYFEATPLRLMRLCGYAVGETFQRIYILETFCYYTDTTAISNANLIVSS